MVHNSKSLMLLIFRHLVDPGSAPNADGLGSGAGLRCKGCPHGGDASDRGRVSGRGGGARAVLSGEGCPVDQAVALPSLPTQRMVMNYLLCLQWRCGAEVAVCLRPGSTVRIGRDRSNDISVASSTVSRRHCAVRHNGGAVVVYDERSLNGTYVNG
jgi:hypothetical protein